MSGDNWFSFSEDSGFQQHASAEDSRAEAQRALDYNAEEASCDGWPVGTDRICWGEVREAAVKTDTHKHGPDCRPDSGDDGDDDTCTEGYSMLFDHICEFNMTPTVPPGEIDALRARAEAADAEVARVAAERDEARAAAGAAAAVAQAAQAEVARLRAALEQASADALSLAVAAYGLDDCGWLDQMQAAGLTGAEADMLEVLHGRLYDRPKGEVVATLRRTLGGAR